MGISDIKMKIVQIKEKKKKAAITFGKEVLLIDAYKNKYSDRL